MNEKSQEKGYFRKSQDSCKAREDCFAQMRELQRHSPWHEKIDAEPCEKAG